MNQQPLFRIRDNHIGPLVALIASMTASGAGAQQFAMNDYLRLSIEELSQIKISSVSKQEESLSEAPASIYVITGGDINSSGATTIPEALRLAPNLNVARRSSTEYAITARGFNNTIGNKLLVLMDGRTLYTPLFSGVFWGQQDTMLEDIDRIEVISGPGATLWGVNAVNGVINIITRSAEDTQGALITVHGGNFERGFGARYGGTLGDAHYRVYAKGLQVDESPRSDGLEFSDEFTRVQAGFRVDRASGNDSFTFQGDVFEGRSVDRGVILGLEPGREEVSGANLQARWNRSYEDGADLQVQAYWDHSERHDFFLYEPDTDIYDLDFQYGKPLDGHRLLVGGGHRRGKDRVGPGFPNIVFMPESRSLDWSNLFIQDEISLTENLDVTVGVKFERNDYTGVENLPSVRLAWKLSGDHLLWNSLSRAVRTPSRFDRDVFTIAPPFFQILGGPNFESEVADVFELGYRAQFSDDLNLSITGFYHEWDKLRSGEITSFTPFLTLQLENKIEGPVYGGEAWANWQVTDSWRLGVGAVVLRKDLRLKPDSTDPAGVANELLANDPEYQRTLRSSLELPGASRLDIHARYVSELPNPVVPSYTAVDAFYSLRLDGFEIGISLQNLFDTSHIEFDSPSASREHERKAFLKLTWMN